MKQKAYLALLVLAGVCGAICRGISLTYGFEQQTGLPNGSPANAMAVILTVAVCVGLPVLCRVWFSDANGKAYEDLFAHASRAGIWSGVLCGAFVCAGGMAGFALLPLQMKEQINDYVQEVPIIVLLALVAMWVLTVLSGVSMIVLTLHQQDKPMTAKLAMFSVLPMFWACINLVMAYHENSSNPVLQSYAYELLLSAAIMAAFYFLACFFYAECPTSRFLALAGIVVYLMMFCAGGMAIGMLMGAELKNATVGMVIRLISSTPAALFLLIQAKRVTGRCGRT